MIAPVPVHCFSITSIPSTHRGRTQNLALTGQAVLEKVLEIVDDDGRTPDHGYAISSLGEPSAHVSYNQGIKLLNAKDHVR